MPHSPIAPPQGTEQRRRVAILFADLVGSTALADRTEAEVAYHVVSGFLTGLGDIVNAAGGYVVKTLGDGLMALFGAPVAHGDDPDRAARAALRMQTWMGEYGEQVRQEHGLTLQLRVGINYGSVVATALSAGGRPTYDALGDTVNVAQRVESQAEPGSVCVSEPFYRLTRGRFEYAHRGTAQVKGKPEPLQLYRLIGEREAASVAAEAILPLVGRDVELRRLQHAARSLAEGQGSFIALVADAGLGKTRLLDELAGELAALGIPQLRAAAAETWRAAPLSLWRAWLLELLPIDPSLSHPEATRRIAAALSGPGRADWAGWLAALAVDSDRFLALDPQDRASITRQALRALLDDWRGDGPAALLVDEAAWLDQPSLQLLRDFAVDGPILLVLAGREDDRYPPEEGEPLPLAPLSDESARALLTAALPVLQTTPELCPRLVARAGGNLLFLESMVRAAREAPDPEAALNAVPDTLYALLQAQIDALPPTERHLLEAAAILGRSFEEPWLLELAASHTHTTAPTPWVPDRHSPTTAHPLHALEARGLLIEQRPPPGRELAFRHGALPEVVDESLLQTSRRELHRRAGGILAADAARRPELAARVAQHWRHAEERERALEWTLSAAAHAAALYAGEEARQLYQEALALALGLRQSLPLARAAVGLAELAAHAGEFPLAMEHYRTATGAIADGVARGDDPDEPFCRLQAAVLRGQARLHGQLGQPGLAVPLLEQALAALQGHEGEEALREEIRCLTEQAHTLCDLGQLEPALAAAEAARARAEALGWDSEAAAAGSALGRIYPLAGDWPAAERALRRAIDRAAAAGDWQRAASCGINLGNGLQAAGRFAEAIAALETARDQAQRIGDAEKEALVQLSLGAVRLNRGDWEGAALASQEAAARFRRMPHPLGTAAALCNLADAARCAGRLEAARAALDEAAALQEQLDVPYLQAHLAAAQAALSLAEGDPDTAARLARHALEQARAAGHEPVVHAAHLALGSALVALGDPTAAAAELEAAALGFEAAGETLDAARAKAAWAAALARHGDLADAARLHQEAVAAVEALDARPWLEQLPGFRVQGSGFSRSGSDWSNSSSAPDRSDWSDPSDPSDPPPPEP